VTRVESFVPAVGWLRHYDRAWLSRDVVGGLAAGAVVVPQAMAYATIADLPVEVGLYTCMVPMVVYALLGGSRTASVSTTSTVAVLTGSTLIAAGVAAQSGDPVGDLAMLTLLVGLILLVARLFKLGSIVDNISEATLIGIKVGVGLTVAAGQLPKLLGVTTDPERDSFIFEIAALFDELGNISWTTAAFSAGTIAVLLVCTRVAPRVPAPLVVVAGGILLVAVANVDEHGVALIDRVPSGLPTPVWPSFDHAVALLPGAFAIAIMCFLETVAVGLGLRRPTEPAIDNDQELVANGLSCIAGACFRAMPSAGGFSQSAINQSSGAVSQLSELVTAALAVACALFLGGVLSDLPAATLGCMVVVAVLGLIKPAEVVRLFRLSRVEFWVAAITAGAGLVFGLLQAVLVGVLLTLFLVLRELDRAGLTELQPVAGDADLHLAGSPGTAPVPGLLVLRYDAPLYTANIRSVHRKILAAVDAAPTPLEVVVLDASAVTVLPVTVIDAAPEVERELIARGVVFWIAGLTPRARATAEQLPRWRELDDAGRIQPTALAAVRAFRAGRRG
jgi:high affinity sulfate transporter 1